jgi:hypothetical protein
VARSFVRSSSQYLSVNLPQETGKLSVGYIFKQASNPADDNYPNRFGVLARGDASNEENFYVLHQATGINVGFTSASGVFHEFVGQWTSDTSEHDVLINWDWDDDVFEVFLDGTALTMNNIGSLTANPQTTGTAMHIARAGDEHFDGWLAEVTIWQGVRMVQADADLWHSRYVRSVRPGAMTRQWPLIGTDDPEPDRIGGFNATLVNGPAQATHPFVIYTDPPSDEAPAAEQPTGGWKRGRGGFAYTREEYDRLIQRQYEGVEERTAPARPVAPAVEPRTVRGLLDKALNDAALPIIVPVPELPVGSVGPIVLPPSFEAVKRAVEQRLEQQRLIDEMLSEAQFRAIEAAAFEEAARAAAEAAREAEDEEALIALLLAL